MAAKVIIRGGAGNAVQIQGRDAADIAPTNGQALAWDAGDSAWEPQTISSGGSAEWTDTGSVLHPSEETVDNVVVGGTTTGNSDIVLGVDGSAKFNEQGASVDFNIKSANQAKMFHVDGTNDTVGIGCDPVEAGDDNPSALLFVSNRATPTTPASYAPLVVENDDAASYVNIISNDAGWTGVLLGDQSAPDEGGILYNSSNQRMYFKGNADSASTAVAMIDHSAHRVGIDLGTAAPNEALDVNGALSLKAQSSTPSVAASYAKIYTDEVADNATRLLMHCDGADNGTTFTDSSENNYTVTRYNAVTKTGVVKIGSASAYFDGAGDYLTVPQEAGQFSATENFTVELWVYMSAGGDAYQDVINKQGASGKSGWAIGRYESSGGLDPRIYANIGDGTVGTGFTPILSGQLNYNEWYHVALVRNNGTNEMFINGTSAGTNTQSYSDYQDLVYIGMASTAAGGTAREWKGYADEIRISATARYTSSFTPATTAFGANGRLNLPSPLKVGDQVSIVESSSPPQAIQGEAKIYSLNDGNPETNPDIHLLCNFNTAIEGDSQYQATFTTGGSPIIDTSVKRFGAGSCKFISSDSDYINTTSQFNTIKDFSGAMTWDFWIYFNTVSSRQGLISSSANDDFTLELSAANKFVPGYRESGGQFWNVTGAKTDFVTGQWYHFAWVKDASHNMYTFIDGVLDGENTSSKTGSYVSGSSSTNMGKVAFGGGYFFNGNLDSVRYTNYARWSGSGYSLGDQVFIPPTAENQGETELYALDSAGNHTKLSPHTGSDWEYFSRNKRTGRTTKINMIKAMRILEQLSGEKIIIED